ncbi:hypothetical protein PMI14_06777 [Acidovorax sp. CF316]|nr:hypothetical protein PMI14_06777 [Acidovorax sp. CF316]
MGLEQLESPPVSVKALLDWFMSPAGADQGFQNPLAPLASVEALASADAPVVIDTHGAAITLEAAIQDNVQQAFEDWLARLKGHPDNVGIFYFCGHGVMVADHHLLCEDFGRSLQPWNKAFNISLTIRAVEREIRGSVFFFIDACRKIPRAVAMSLGASGPPLLPPNLGASVSRRHTTTIYAAGEGELAFAPRGGAVSRFTSTLLCALSGYCGVKAPGQQTWTVDGENLSSAIRTLLEQNEPDLSGKAGSGTQVCEQLVTGPLVPLMRLSTAPSVKVRLDLAPRERRALYDLYLSSSKGNHRVAQNKKDQIFKVELPRGVYEVGAADPDNKLLPVIYVDEELSPPMYLFTMQSLP